MRYYEIVKKYFLTHMIVFGVSVAVLIAVVLTTVSMWAYNVSDVARLDVSRPGYETIRDDVQKAQQSKKFGATGELNQQALDDFQDLYDERMKNLNNLGRFDGIVLNDDQLKLADPEASEPVPTE